MSNAEAVKEFTEGYTGHSCPTHPLPMKKDAVLFIIRMVMSELDELASTVTRDEQECKDFMQQALDSIDKCQEYSYPDRVQLIAAQADAMVDAWYYMLNTSAKHGINLSKLFEVVHQANMNKRDPKTGKFIRRESDGKVIKPDDWKEPDICAVIKDQLERGAWS